MDSFDDLLAVHWAIPISAAVIGRNNKYSRENAEELTFMERTPVIEMA